MTSQNLVDCARWSIPIKFVSMPLSGFIAPVTLVGSPVQQTAETVSSLVISQLVNPGHPILYGGSPANGKGRGRAGPADYGRNREEAFSGTTQ